MVKPTVKLRLGRTRVDDRQRLLAYLEWGEGNVSTDVGQDLVSRGFSLVYTAYPFNREQAYLKAEDVALTEKRGLWANAAMVSRIRGLQAIWAEKREEGASK